MVRFRFARQRIDIFIIPPNLLRYHFDSQVNNLIFDDTTLSARIRYDALSVPKATIQYVTMPLNPLRYETARCDFGSHGNDSIFDESAKSALI